MIGSCRNCPLNDLECSLNESKVDATDEKAYCRDFSLCSFESGFCGLSHSKNYQLKWIRNSGKTSSDGTGPQSDHTRCNKKDGDYIYIDASKGKKGDKARLESDWLSAGETLCLQFWYHMWGVRMGTLRILMKTNQFEITVWEEFGNQEDEWQFGQTPLKPDGQNQYKFVIEAETIDGDEGDIAVDDVRLNEGSCQKIIDNRKFNQRDVRK
ncbi:MAM and LDL-receptor class A domain-containing protein 1 [Exaiptasia diaphana]|uniref:MAM domain-containing protein n=1 Tax=Exaiptasia diaphana TaxID=2652724 RepID=A0A913YQM1_EXADI|nr:MAM and LDL-receptor class A domain-containing protein 1 [Exaiptasia diaphana]